MKNKRIDDEANRQLGMRLRAARIHRNMSLAELASALPKSINLERHEHGTTSILLSDLRNIAIILDVPIYYFMGDAELLHWFDERKFVATYRVLKPAARQKVQNLVFSIAGDHPIMPS